MRALRLSGFPKSNAHGRSVHWRDGGIFHAPCLSHRFPEFPDEPESVHRRVTPLGTMKRSSRSAVADKRCSLKRGSLQRSYWQRSYSQRSCRHEQERRFRKSASNGSASGTALQETALARNCASVNRASGAHSTRRITHSVPVCASVKDQRLIIPTLLGDETAGQV